MSVLFAFAALLALVAAQCSLEGNTYINEVGGTVTFGAAVNGFLPYIANPNDPSEAVFGTATQTTATLWEVTDFGGVNGASCTETGQYNIMIGNNCQSVTFTPINDNCGDRVQFLSAPFTYVTPDPGADCQSPGTVLTATLESSTDLPVLSNLPATWVFGNNQLAIASVDGRFAIFQLWGQEADGSSDLTTVRDFLSIPDGVACSPTKTGSFNGTWNSECQARFCGVSDGCFFRGELYSGIEFNGWTAPADDEGCTGTIEKPGWGGLSKCSVDEEQWLGHPYDCVNQFDKGECMFCRGINGGQTVSMCLDRLGAQCDVIFNTDARKAYCNLAFECPASTATVSLAVFIFALLALFLH